MSNSDSERRALKSCPFCGAEVECTELSGIVVIECGTKGCPGNGDSYEPRSVESGIRQWNTRAEDPALSRIRAALNLDEGVDVVAEVERIVNCCKQGRQRATNFLAGLDPRSSDVQLLVAGMIDALRNDFIDAVDPNHFGKVAALVAAKERTE